MTALRIDRNSELATAKSAYVPEFLSLPYAQRMDSNEKRRLAHVEDLGLAACAIRLRAARAVAGLSQTAAAKVIGVTRQNLNNMEAGLNFPNRDVMQFFHREHRIDFNFLMAGLYAQLPGDVQALLFPALATANSEWDQKEG